MESTPTYRVHVELDAFTAAASRAFDYEFTGDSKFTGWSKPEVGTFQLGVIVGGSGTGKTLLLGEFGDPEDVEWNSSKAIVSHFESPEDAFARFAAVGLNSIPTWCKPYHVLSVGEKFRADLSRRLKDGAVVDEFTSTVDRSVARSCSVALRRYIYERGLSGVVLATCHYDVLPWLQPDWHFDTSNGQLHIGRWLQRPDIKLRIYKSAPAFWTAFAGHHYLNHQLNKTAWCFVCTSDFGSGEVPVAFDSSLTMPSGSIKKARREHRLVVLSDYQGLGIGPKMSDAVAEWHIKQGFKFYSRTAHPRLGSYRDCSPLWRKTSKYRVHRNDLAKRTLSGNDWASMHAYLGDSTRVCYSHEYVGSDN